MTSVEMRATLSAFGAPPQPALATVVHRNPGERTLRALVGAGIFWGLALLGLFVPVAHLVLVPALLAAGLIAGVRRAREEWTLVTVRGSCPRCGRTQEFAVGGRLTTERSFDCPACHNYLNLVTGDAAGGA